MSRRVLALKRGLNGALQGIQIAMKNIGIGKVLEMQPEALNRIEKGTVLGQPQHQQLLFKSCERRLSGIAAVVGGVIHDQDQTLLWINREG